MSKNVWIPVRIPPTEVGSYLVTTAKGAIIMDRWDGEHWARCVPRYGIKKRFGSYEQHRGWTYLPQPMSEVEQ